jgi:hypothetical protein
MVQGIRRGRMTYCGRYYQGNPTVVPSRYYCRITLVIVLLTPNSVACLLPVLLYLKVLLTPSTYILTVHDVQRYAPIKITGKKSIILS